MGFIKSKSFMAFSVSDQTLQSIPIVNSRIYCFDQIQPHIVHLYYKKNTIQIFAILNEVITIWPATFATRVRNDLLGSLFIF